MTRTPLILLARLVAVCAVCVPASVTPVAAQRGGTNDVPDRVVLPQASRPGPAETWTSLAVVFLGTALTVVAATYPSKRGHKD